MKLDQSGAIDFGLRAAGTDANVERFEREVIAALEEKGVSIGQTQVETGKGGSAGISDQKRPEESAGEKMGSNARAVIRWIKTRYLGRVDFWT